MNGTQVCVSIPGKSYTRLQTTRTLAPSIPGTPASVPTDVANGTNIHCGRYYQTELGNDCNLLIIKFGIALADFIFLNPQINENCTNLLADDNHCVQKVGDSK